MYVCTYTSVFFPPLRLSVRPLPSAVVRNVMQRCCISVCVRLQRVQSGKSEQRGLSTTQSAVQHGRFTTGSVIHLINRASVCA